MHILQKLFKDKARSYSGRGMFGKTCLGIEVPNIDLFYYDLIHYLEDSNKQDIQSALHNMKQDHMGKNMIIYFPSIQYEISFQEEKSAWEEAYNNFISKL
jgi:hypothetical protein